MSISFLQRLEKKKEIDKEKEKEMNKRDVR